MATKDLYDELIAVNATMEHHESDLYVRATPEVFEIVKRHYGEIGGKLYSPFWSEGQVWLEIPFGYSPFFSRK